MEMRWRYIMLYLVVIVAYVLISLTAPITGKTYDLTRFSRGLLQMTIILPIILIWFVGLQGARGLKRYASTLRPTSKRRALNTIAMGTVVLVSGLIVSSLIGTLRPYAVTNGWIEEFRIFTNYLNVTFPLVGMYLLYRGSARLVEETGTARVRPKYQVFLVVVLLTVLAGLITLLFGNPYRSATPDPAKYQSFYLSDSLIIGTLFVPYLAVWLFGGLAGLNMHRYSQSVRSHRRAFKRVAHGILTIILSLISIQFLTVSSSTLSGLGLAPLLLLIYILLIIYGAGYFLIASGARKLQQSNRDVAVTDTDGH